MYLIKIVSMYVWASITRAFELSQELESNTKSDHIHEIDINHQMRCVYRNYHGSSSSHLRLAFPLVLAVLHEQPNILHDSSRDA